MNLPSGHVRTHKNVVPIGFDVLTFIGYKQTDKQTDRQAKFIYRCIQADRKLARNKK